MATSMAVNSGARIWSPFRELHETVEAAIYRQQPDAIHDLELALRKHKPDFISLLRPPKRSSGQRDLVRQAVTGGLPIHGEQRTQTFTQQFIDEALILSDLFDLDEFMAVELLMAGENQQPNFPGLARGLVAVLLFYDGRRSLTNSLKALIQSREGQTWTLGLSEELVAITTKFIDQLVEEGLTYKVLALISEMNFTIEFDKLQKERALGPAKHCKQVADIFKEIKMSLAESLFSLACQQPLNKADTLRLIGHLRADNSAAANGTLEPVTSCLLMTLLYCFDVSILEREDIEDAIQKLAVVTDDTYLTEIHREITAEQAWASQGLKAVAQFSWAICLRQLSQYPTIPGINDFCEEDEMIIDSAIHGHIFQFLRECVIATSEFHQEEFYLRRIHGLLTDFIFHMPLKVKELRNHGDEVARIIMALHQEGREPPVTLRRDFEHMLNFIGDLYAKDPLNLELALEYWCPSESHGGQDAFTSVMYRPPQRQVSLYKFVRLAGDLLPASLYVPYVSMVTGLASGPQCAQHCFSLLKMNGGAASNVSWDHFFLSLNQYYTNLRREVHSAGEVTHAYRTHHLKSITPQEMEGLITVLRLIRCVAEQNENCRLALCENQQWASIVLLFGLVSCNLPPQLKAELLRTLTALGKTAEIASTLWQSLEVSQILPTVNIGSTGIGGIKVELEEIESRNEEYPITLAFLGFLDTLTNNTIPAGLGAGYRAPGFDPYLDYILDTVFLQFNSRAYKKAGEKWDIAAGALEIFSKLLRKHEIATKDFHNQMVEVQGGGTVAANKPPAHALLTHMLRDSGLFRMVLKILDEAASYYEEYTELPGKSSLARASLLCLKLLETSLDKEDEFVDAIRETGASLMVIPLDRLLLGINPRTGKADHVVNIAKYVMFNSFLAEHALSASRILYLVCRSPSVQSELVHMFTATESISVNLLQGFVECLEVDDPEVKDKSELAENYDEVSGAEIRNATRQHLLQLLLRSTHYPAPNLSHFLLGYDIRKPVSRTNLQDPGILGSPRTCLHSVLSILDRGVGSRSGPRCLVDIPKTAELGYQLIYVLCANKETSAPTLRYLRTTHDFLYRQLQHLPFKVEEYGPNVVNNQSWLLKTVAIELRITSLNRQRSHTQRLMRMLLDDSMQVQATGLNQIGEETEVAALDREQTFLQSTAASQSKIITGHQMRRKLLDLLDYLDLGQVYPDPLRLEILDPRIVEQVVRSCETQPEIGVAYCNVKRLNRKLMTELTNLLSVTMAGQRPLLTEDVQSVLRTVIARNKMRESLHAKRQAFESWRQVTEVLLTACPEDLLSGEMRQTVLFELMQDLLIKVADEDALPELTAPVAGVILTLMANLRQCFLTERQLEGERIQSSSHYVSLLDRTQSGISTSHREFDKTSGSRTLFASSLQIVLKGLIEHILRSSGGQQRVRASLYGALLYFLQISQKPMLQPVLPSDLLHEGASRLLGSDSECEQLAKENLSTISSYGDNLMDVFCRDACDGHDVGRMLALSVLDAVLSMDNYQQWLSFMTSKGYVQHLVDSLTHDDQQLQTVLGDSTEPLRVLYIYESKMSLLTRVAGSPVGAHTLLRCGLLQRMAQCSFFDMRPDGDRSSGRSTMLEVDDDDFVPNPAARYRHLLFAALKLCLAILTSLGIENRDATYQVMQFVSAHGDVFYNILRDRHSSISLPQLQELALTTAVLARATYLGELESDYEQGETALLEFRRYISRIQRQMIALLPKYCMSDRLMKHFKSIGGETEHGRHDVKAEIMLANQEIAANVVAFSRALVTASGPSAQYCRILFGPSLEEALSRDFGNRDEFQLSTHNPMQSPNLGVIVYQLKQCANQFMTMYGSHQQYERKLGNLADLSAEDLKELSGVTSTEKLSSQQRMHIVKKRLIAIVGYKVRELQHYSCMLQTCVCLLNRWGCIGCIQERDIDIIENCVFILWRHLEYYLLHCVPMDKQPSLYQVAAKRQQQLRRLQDVSSPVIHSQDVPVTSEYDDSSRGVSREELDLLRQTAVSVINETLFKKLQEVNQVFSKNRTRYGFTEAIIRRIKCLLRLHTGS